MASYLSDDPLLLDTGNSALVEQHLVALASLHREGPNSKAIVYLGFRQVVYNGPSTTENSIEKQ